MVVYVMKPPKQKKPIPVPSRAMVVYERTIHLLVITPTSYRASATALLLALAPTVCILVWFSLSLLVFSKILGHS